MRFQDVPVDPDDVAEQVREVMSRPEFRYDKSLLERFGQWISEQLEKLFGDVQPGAPQAGAFGGGAGTLVAWLIIVLAVVAVVAVVVYVVMRRVRRPEDEPEPAVDHEIVHRNPASHWANEAERLEAEGEWKAALRCRYRELVRTLVDRSQLPDIAGRTTGELRADLRRSTPAAEPDFDRATLLFELAWYADAPTGAEENAAFRRGAATALDRPVEQRFDSAGLLAVRDEVPA